jgi:hypothetical protein
MALTLCTAVVGGLKIERGVEIFTHHIRDGHGAGVREPFRVVAQRLVNARERDRINGFNRDLGSRHRKRRGEHASNYQGRSC